MKMSWFLIALLFAAAMPADTASPAEPVTISGDDILNAFKTNVTFNNDILKSFSADGSYDSKDPLKREAAQSRFWNALQIEKLIEKHCPPSIPARNQREKDWILRSTNLIFSHPDMELCSLSVQHKCMRIIIKSKVSTEYAPPPLSDQQIALIAASFELLFERLKQSVQTRLPLISETDANRRLDYHCSTVKGRIIVPTDFRLKKALASRDIDSISATFDAKLESTESLAFERLEKVRSEQDISEEHRKVREDSVLGSLFSEMVGPVIDQVEKRTEVEPSKPLEGVTADHLVPGYEALRDRVTALFLKNEEEWQARRKARLRALMILDKLNPEDTVGAIVDQGLEGSPDALIELSPAPEKPVEPADTEQPPQEQPGPLGIADTPQQREAPTRYNYWPVFCILAALCILATVSILLLKSKSVLNK